MTNDSQDISCTRDILGLCARHGNPSCRKRINRLRWLRGNVSVLRFTRPAARSEWNFTYLPDGWLRVSHDVDTGPIEPE